MSLEYKEDDPQTAGDLDRAEPVYVAPRPVYTIILILGIAAVFAAQIAGGLEDSTLRAGFYKPAFLAGQYLVFGLVLYRIIDNYGHIGGLIFGALYGLVQIPSDQYVDPRVTGPITKFAGVAAVGIYLAACAFSILLILRVVG